MEERKETCREIVEVYRQPEPAEVVEVYSRPLPAYMAGSQTPPAPKGRRRPGKGFWIFLGCFLLVAVLTVIAVVTADRNHEDHRPEYDWGEFEPEEETGEITIPTYTGERTAALMLARERGETLTAQQIYQQVNPSVVTVMVEVGGGMSVGTGVIFTEDGYIITNHHVLNKGSDCVVMLDEGYVYDAFYVAGDAANDLAILKIDGEDLPAAEFAESDLLMVGDPVYAIGNPLGVELRGTLTDGIVSAINRDVWVDDRSMTLIQTNAALNSGNSGGPLINESGQVVGINVIKMTSRYDSVEGLGFAIPTSEMQRMINDLLVYDAIQPEPLLGLSVLLQAEDAAEGVRGLRVDSVTPGGAAETAGIRKGDIVLTAGDEPLETSDRLLRVRQRFHLGDTMPVTIWRDGEIIEVNLYLLEAVQEEQEPPWYVN